MYEIDLKPTSLERHIQAGRLMLRCGVLAFADVSLLLNQRKSLEVLLSDPTFCRQLEEVVGSGSKKNVDAFAAALLPSPVLAKQGEKVAGKDQNVAAVLNRVVRDVCDAVPLSLDKVNPVPNLTARQLAVILGMDFGNIFRDETASVVQVDR